PTKPRPRSFSTARHSRARRARSTSVSRVATASRSDRRKKKPPGTPGTPGTPDFGHGLSLAVTLRVVLAARIALPSAAHFLPTSSTTRHGTILKDQPQNPGVPGGPGVLAVDPRRRAPLNAVGSATPSRR